MLDRDSAYHAAELERCKLRPESAQRIRQRLRKECQSITQEKQGPRTLRQLAPWLKVAACFLLMIGSASLAVLFTKRCPSLRNGPSPIRQSVPAFALTYGRPMDWQQPSMGALWFSVRSF